MLVYPKTRICTGCLREQSLLNFHLDRGRPRSVCKECTSKGITSAKTGIRIKKIYVLPKTQVCTACSKEKETINFYIRNGRITKSWCKECHQKHLRKWRIENSEKHDKQNQSYQKTYHSKHPEYLKNWWKKQTQEASPTYMKQILKGRDIDSTNVSETTVEFIRKTLLLRREINAKGKSPFKDA